MTDASDIEAEAASWVARCDASGLANDTGLTAWLLADPRHRAAFLRLAEAWVRTERLTRLRPTNGPVDADLLAPHRVDSVRPAASRRVCRWAAAALAMGIMLLAWSGLSRHQNVRIYQTGPTELSRIMLADGTIATLNADTKLRVSFTPRERNVELVRGEAQFAVVHHGRRLFQVTVDGRRIRDVGTKFDVRRESAHLVEVMVIRGRVAVLPAHAASLALGSAVPLLWGGDVAILTRHNVAVRRTSRAQIEHELRWERRKLYFKGETLRQAITQFNQYNYRKIIIATPMLSRLRIGGTFRAFAVRSFVAALGRSFGIAARPGPHHSILLYRPAAR